jgi:hypothetical protein
MENGTITQINREVSRFAMHTSGTYGIAAGDCPFALSERVFGAFSAVGDVLLNGKLARDGAN